MGQPASVKRTFVMCKPDAVERGLIGVVVGRLEAKGLHLAAAELRHLTPDAAARHYDEHRDKPFFADLLAFVTRSPSFLMVVEGPDEVVAVVRRLIGATNPVMAEPGTIRGDLAPGWSATENLVHASDGDESAGREIAHFFPNLT